MFNTPPVNYIREVPGSCDGLWTARLLGELQTLTPRRAWGEGSEGHGSSKRKKNITPTEKKNCVGRTVGKGKYALAGLLFARAGLCPLHSQRHSETSHPSPPKQMSSAPYKAFLALGKVPEFCILGEGGGSQAELCPRRSYRTPGKMKKKPQILREERKTQQQLF